jgi:RNA polymerase sporulation-specific sigma factor
VTRDRLEHLRACAIHATRDLVYLPGSEREDLIQEAMVGLAEALRDYKPGAGMKLESFVALCARRKALSAIKAANRGKQLLLTRADRTTHVEAEIVPALDVTSDPAADTAAQAIGHVVFVERAKTCTAAELHALFGVAAGYTYAELGDTKQIDNALQRARVKLKAAA